MVKNDVNVMVKKTVELSKDEWDIIRKDADKCGHSFEFHIVWLLTADFISEEKLRAREERVNQLKS